MDRPFWLVSNPPQTTVDVEAAAAALDLSVAETRMKVNFGAPEVWLAFPERGPAMAAAEMLGAAGLAVDLVDARKLGRLPGPLLAESFRFDDDGLSAVAGDEEVRLPYESRVLAVLCIPPADFSYREPAYSAAGSIRAEVGRNSTSAFMDRLSGSAHLRGRSDPGALERMPTLELYGEVDGRIIRVSITEGAARFDGLGSDMRPRARDNLELCLQRIGERIPHLETDTRLVNVRPRQRRSVGVPHDYDDSRRLYSFGTLGLQSLLETVSPELGEITQSDLGSRLSYLLADSSD